MTNSARVFVPRDKANNPAPVPGASQLVALPFISALAGYLHNGGVADRTRVVLHRALSRQGGEYLQQVSAYAGTPYDPSTVGRMNAVTTGIIGKAYARKQIIRTRLYPDDAQLLVDLQADMDSVGDTRNIDHVARSFLAVPIVSSGESVVAVLFADTFSVNAFADDAIVDTILGMTREYCRLIDALIEYPLPGIQNYELLPGKPVEDRISVYPRLQEVLVNKEIPKFTRLASLNFEASV